MLKALVAAVVLAVLGGAFYLVTFLNQKDNDENDHGHDHGHFH